AIRGATSYLYELFQEQGDMQSANEQLARITLNAEKSADPRGKYDLILCKAQLALMSGRFKEGQQLAYEASALGQQAHYPVAPTRLGVQLAITYLDEGHLGD